MPLTTLSLTLTLSVGKDTSYTEHTDYTRLTMSVAPTTLTLYYTTPKPHHVGGAYCP